MKIIRATAAEVDSHDELEDIIGTSMSEDDVRWFIAQPQTMFSSDGELHGAHPRGAGAFPRVLGRYVREEKVLPLEMAIHKMTGLSAQQLGLKDRGRIAEGYIADLVIFDPTTVIDQSTIEHPEAPPLGIPSVMVSGEWVIDDGAVTGKHPGHVLRPSPVGVHHDQSAGSGLQFLPSQSRRMTRDASRLNLRGSVSALGLSGDLHPIVYILEADRTHGLEMRRIGLNRCPYCGGSEVYVSTAKTFWKERRASCCFGWFDAMTAGAATSGRCSCRRKMRPARSTVPRIPPESTSDHTPEQRQA